MAYSFSFNIYVRFFFNFIIFLRYFILCEHADLLSAEMFPSSGFFKDYFIFFISFSTVLALLMDSLECRTSWQATYQHDTVQLIYRFRWLFPFQRNVQQFNLINIFVICITLCYSSKSFIPNIAFGFVDKNNYKKIVWPVSSVYIYIYILFHACNFFLRLHFLLASVGKSLLLNRTTTFW